MLYIKGGGGGGGGGGAVAILGSSGVNDLKYVIRS